MARYFSALVISSTICCASLIPLPAFADYSLTILHTNDLHSRIEPVNKYDSTCSVAEQADNQCFGGIARLKAAIDQRRGSSHSSENILLLDAGDQFQGSLFFTTYKGADTAEFMNAIGYDAMTLGNHEFDNGTQGLAPFLDAVNFPVLAANIETDPTSPIHGKYQSSIIKELGGEKIGIIGLTTTDTPEISSPGEQVRFKDEIQALNDQIAALKSQGVNKIIALTHLGYQRDQELASKIDGIDVFVGGHSHSLLSNEPDETGKVKGPYPTFVTNPSGSKSIIVSAYAYSQYLGNISITFDDDGNIIHSSGNPVRLDATIKPDEALARRIAQMAEPLNEIKNKQVAIAQNIIDGSGDNCRIQECSMGNLVADAMLDRSRNQGIDIAIINGGALRASINQGEISMGDVITVLPFQNTLSTFQLKGSDIIASLENGVSQTASGSGHFPQVAGLKFSHDPSQPAGKRISNIMVQNNSTTADAKAHWSPLLKDKTYGVAATNYLRSGGDGYSHIASNAAQAYDFGPGLEEVVADYLEHHNPYQPYLDGRISQITQPNITGQDDFSEDELPQASNLKSTYLVQKGESYWTIADKLYGDGMFWKRLQQANPQFTPRQLPAGTTIRLPDQ